MRESEHHAFTHSSYALDPHKSTVLAMVFLGPHDVIRLLQLIRSSDTPRKLSKLPQEDGKPPLWDKGLPCERPIAKLAQLRGCKGTENPTSTIETTARLYGFTPT